MGSSMRASSSSVAWMASNIKSLLPMRSHANLVSSACRMLRADSSSRALMVARTSFAAAALRISLETWGLMDEDEGEDMVDDGRE